jgi:uncharacterized protein
MSGRLPEENVLAPIVRQDWRSLAFMHWPVDPEALVRLLPDDLEPDLVDGRAWIGLTPFRVQRARVGGLPIAFPRSAFSETNLRTYVRHRNGNDGLWFLSLDVDSTANVAGGRLIGAPYFRSRMSVTATSVDGAEAIRYRCRRLGSDVGHDVTVIPGESIEPDAWLDQLTGRWRAYTVVAGRTLEVPVSHEPWPLRDATIAAIEESVVAASGLPAPTSDLVAHCSDGVDARLGRPRPAPAANSSQERRGSATSKPVAPRARSAKSWAVRRCTCLG